MPIFWDLMFVQTGKREPVIQSRNSFQLENYLSTNSYSEDFKSGSVIEKEDEDQLKGVMTGYQPVPQHPPPSYPQGSASLPRGCAPPSKNASLPRMGASASKSGSLARGVSPIPRAYPALAEAPPGYPESPQKTGPPPLGYPLSPPEYPQTPTPPGICRDFQKISF